MIAISWIILKHILINNILKNLKKDGESVKTNSMIFSLRNQPGGLARALKVFQVSSLRYIIKVRN